MDPVAVASSVEDSRPILCHCVTESKDPDVIVTESTSAPTEAEQRAREQALTDEVVASFADSETKRYRALMTRLVRHLHGFARDVRLTQAEWETAVDFLTRTGHIQVPLGGDLAQGAKGVPCYVSGQVRSTGGTPLAGARIDAWEADEDGRYDTQYDGNRTAGRGWQTTGATASTGSGRCSPSTIPSRTTAR
jgi:hydroxyquinol 1,2-dioxygenase